MRRTKAVVLLFCLLGFAPSCRKALDVQISSPADDATVSEQPVVQGKVSDARAAVWVVVFPLEVADEYWVQPQAAVKPDGTWTAQIYVGDAGKEDAGKQFLLMAVANPKQSLKSGDVLKAWPPAAAQSEVVEVTRK
jgi:hypothetical protein